MRPLAHAAAGAGLGVIVYQVTRDVGLAAAAVSAEVLMDVDHALEHIVRSEHPFSVRIFFSEHNSLDWPRIVFALHSYEVLVLVAAAAWYFDAAFLMWAGVGMALHLALDETGNRRRSSPARLAPWFYFFTWRLLRRFRTDALLAPKGGARRGAPPEGMERKK